jgi:hypothetical protein
LSSVTAAWRGLGLAVAVNLRSKLKFALLTILIAISTLVFLGVTELSRASTSSLDEAIESDLGAAGTYRVEPSADLGLSQDELLSTIRGVSARFTDRPIQVAVRFPSVRPECPPFNQLGDVTAAVMLDSRGLAEPFRSGDLQSAGDLCLAGLVVPHAAIRECTKSETVRFDCSIVVSPLYEQLMRLASPRAPQYAIVVTTGRNEDQSDELKNAMHEALAGAAAKASINLENAIVVARQDSGGSVRSASDGIRLVYRLIAWGVLVVGGIGVLVAELIVLRDRTWFFGLARAVGARRWNVAWLVLADIVIVLAAGLAFSLVILVATAPWVSSFGRTAFQVDLQVLRPSALPGLVSGLVFVLVLGGAYPAWRATRLDPLDVLERR